MHGRAGEIAANPSGWELVNTGRWLPITVQDALTRKAFVVEPGETHPFLLAEATVRLVLRTSESIETVELEVRTASGRAIPAPLAAGGDTVRPVDGPTGVKRTAKYYRVLVELCRPRLEDPSNVTPPSAKELRARLDPVEYPTVRGVEKHLEHLRQLFGLGPERASLADNLAGLEQRSTLHRLAELAIFTGVVTRDDL
jgi:hypothetical protein